MADSDPDVRWMSYAEAARTLRVTPESLHRRMRRSGWARREGNDGKPRVAVPLDVLRRFDPVPDEALDGAPDAQDGVPDNVPDRRDRTIEALEAERDAARLAAAKAEGESATLREQVESERGRADRAEARAHRAEAERDAARAEREAAKVAAASAEGEARGLREALAEARRPFWRRWLG
ncbi:MAG: hypothetical protein ICV73_14270 [Acetobacteraceae bacterium]|nr:hypothetical protein [Acetobacteraceae bacterium]